MMVGGGLTSVELAANIETRGGVWRHLMDLAAGLTAREVDVTISLPAVAQELSEHARRAGHMTVELGESTSAQIFHLHLANTYDSTAKKLLDGKRGVGSVTLVTEHLPRSGASDPTIASRRPKPGATTWKTLKKRRQLRSADGILTVSRGSRDFLRDRYGWADSRMVTVHNGIRPTETLARDEPDNQVPLFLAVGSLIEQKGFDRLVAASTLAEVPWRVQVVGAGPDLGRLQALAQRVSRDSQGARVEFLGWHEDVGSLLARAEALVLPSRWEACPYVVMEAMDAGLAVVATRVDGAVDQVVDDLTGWLVDSTPAAIARGLDAAASDLSRTRLMGQQGRRRVAERFTLDDMITATMGVYEQHLSAKGARA